MKIRNMKSILKSEKFDNCECNFKLKSKGPQAPSWFKEFADKVDKRFDHLENRIDHLVKVNKLKE